MYVKSRKEPGDKTRRKVEAGREGKEINIVEKERNNQLRMRAHVLLYLNTSDVSQAKQNQLSTIETDLFFFLFWKRIFKKESFYSIESKSVVCTNQKGFIK